MQIAPTQRFKFQEHPMWSRVRIAEPDSIYISDTVRVRGRLGALEIAAHARLYDYVCILVEGKVEIGRAAYVNPGAIIHGQAPIKICANVRIGGHVQILTYDGAKTGAIEIGTGACIGPGAILLPGVKIAADAQVAPNAVMGV